MSNLFKILADEKNTHQQEVFTIQEYLEKCKIDKLMYATSAERMLLAIGEPELVDTHSDLGKFI